MASSTLRGCLEDRQRSAEAWAKFISAENEGGITSWSRMRQRVVVRWLAAPKIAGVPHCEVSQSAGDLTLSEKKDGKSKHIRYKVDDFREEPWELSFIDADWEALIQLIRDSWGRSTCGRWPTWSEEAGEEVLKELLWGREEGATWKGEVQSG